MKGEANQSDGIIRVSFIGAKDGCQYLALCVLGHEDSSKATEQEVNENLRTNR